MERVCACVCVCICGCMLLRDGGWRVYRVYMKHHYHIKDMLDSLS